MKGRPVYRELLDRYKEWKHSGKERIEFLKMAAQIPGIYVPQFYEASYNEDGTIASFDKLVKEGTGNGDQADSNVICRIPIIRKNPWCHILK